ncbi:twin-arginine translocation signal domain-containing protein [Streptomyces sp. KL110A]|uniref:twin-arginine translocation signal domain-containing protein n=1 Tax=Streptomyces sp. KL110A TaxID=3384221 RepID=UPI0038C03A1C
MTTRRSFLGRTTAAGVLAGLTPHRRRPRTDAGHPPSAHRTCAGRGRVTRSWPSTAGCGRTTPRSRRI